MGRTAVGSSSNLISPAPLLEPQPANAASGQPARATVVQPTVAVESQQGKDQYLGPGQGKANGGLGLV